MVTTEIWHMRWSTNSTVRSDVTSLQVGQVEEVSACCASRTVKSAVATILAQDSTLIDLFSRTSQDAITVKSSSVKLIIGAVSVVFAKSRFATEALATTGVISD